jgi:hypothetical protein
MFLRKIAILLLSAPVLLGQQRPPSAPVNNRFAVQQTRQTPQRGQQTETQVNQRKPDSPSTQVNQRKPDSPPTQGKPPTKVNPPTPPKVPGWIWLVGGGAALIICAIWIKKHPPHPPTSLPPLTFAAARGTATIRCKKSTGPKIRFTVELRGLSGRTQYRLDDELAMKRKRERHVDGTSNVRWTHTAGTSSFNL